MGVLERTSELSHKVSRARLIELIKTPLSFFVLFVLVAEAFFVYSVQFADISETLKALCVASFIAMIFFVLLFVAFMVWSNPDNLLYDKAAHLARAVALLSDQLSHDKEVEELVRDGRFHYNHKNYRQAEECFENALILNPSYDDARNGIALVKSKMNPEDLSVPIKMLDQVIEDNPLFAKAYYNRACLKTRDMKKKWPKKDIIEDLQIAFVQRPRYRLMAKDDPDLADIVNDKAFQNVLAPQVPKRAAKH
jgi:tetratricopeptide (TPR) repeat protein